MIHIPSEAAINALLKQGLMLRAGPDTFFETSKNHCVILLNKNPRDDDYLIFVSASSQYVKRIEYAQKIGLPTSTLVMLRPGSYHHFPKYTAIDCSRVHVITKGVLITLYGEGRIGLYKTHPNINSEHLNKIIEGVEASPLVQQEVKNLIT